MRGAGRLGASDLQRGCDGLRQRQHLEGGAVGDRGDGGGAGVGDPKEPAGAKAQCVRGWHVLCIYARVCVLWVMMMQQRGTDSGCAACRAAPQLPSGRGPGSAPTPDPTRSGRRPRRSLEAVCRAVAALPLKPPPRLVWEHAVRDVGAHVGGALRGQQPLALYQRAACGAAAGGAEEPRSKESGWGPGWLQVRTRGARVPACCHTHCCEQRSSWGAGPGPAKGPTLAPA